MSSMEPLRWQKHRVAEGTEDHANAGATCTPRRVRFDDASLCTYQDAPVWSDSDSDASAGPSPRTLRRVNAELYGPTLRAHTSDVVGGGGWDGARDGGDVEMLSVEELFYVGEDDYDVESPVSTESSTPATPVDDLPELMAEDVSDRLAHFSLEDPAAGSYMPQITAAGPSPLSEDSQLLFANINSTMRELMGGLKALQSPLEDAYEHHAPNLPPTTEGTLNARPPPTPLRITKGWSHISRRGPSTLAARPDLRLFATRHSRSAILGHAPAPEPEISLSDSEDDEPVRPFGTRGGRRALRRVPTKRHVAPADREFDALGLWAPSASS